MIWLGLSAAFSLVLGTLLVVLVQDALAQRREWRRVLAEVAERLSLAVDEPRFGRPSASGRVRGHPVTLDTTKTSSGRDSAILTRVRVHTGQHDLLVAERRTFQRDGRATGDPAFDDRVWVVGPPAQVAAWLDAPTRRRLADLAEEGIAHEGGAWVSLSMGYASDADALVAVVERLCDWADGLASVDLEQGLLRAAVDNDLPAVRRRAAEHLLDALEARGEPVGPEVLEVLESPRACAEVRVRAARLRGEGGREALRRWMRDPDPDVATVAALALAALPHPEGEDGLESTLRTLAVRGERAVVEALGAVGTVGSVPALQVLAQRRLSLDGSAQAARDAIAAIQARVPGAERGAVSEAAGAGTLSEVVAVGGEVAESPVAGGRGRRRPDEERP